MTNDQRVDVRIRLTDLGAVRWPASPIVGSGEPVTVAVPLPKLVWMRTKTVELPLGSDVAERIATVTRLRKLIEYVVIPAVVLLFVLTMVFMVLDWTQTVPDGRNVAGVLGLVAFALVLVCITPTLVATSTQTPRVVGGEVWLPSARADVVSEATALNPSGLIRVNRKR